MHREQRPAGFREDLGQARGICRVASGDDVGPAGALDEHDPLEQVWINPRTARGSVDQRAIARHSRRGRNHPARALGEQHLGTARRRAPDECRFARGDVPERIAGAGRLADPRQRYAYAPSTLALRDDHRDRQYHR